MLDRNSLMAMVGRSLLAVIFLASAFGKVTEFEKTVVYMEAHGVPLSTEVLPILMKQHRPPQLACTAPQACFIVSAAARKPAFRETMPYDIMSFTPMGAGDRAGKAWFSSLVRRPGEARLFRPG